MIVIMDIENMYKVNIINIGKIYMNMNNTVLIAWYRKQKGIYMNKWINE